MPKKKGGKGGKKKRRGRKQTANAGHERKVLKSDGPQQRYAQAKKMLGDRQIIANVYDPDRRCWDEKLIHVRGKFRKRVWINIDDYVLISTRDFQSQIVEEGKLEHGGDVIHKYQPNEIKKLVKAGEITLEDHNSSGGTQGRYNNMVFVDSEDSENAEEDSVEDPDKPRQPIIAPQRIIKMPTTESDSLEIDDMNADELQDALTNL